MPPINVVNGRSSMTINNVKRFANISVAMATEDVNLAALYYRGYK